MKQIEKTVFISYRRTNYYPTLAIYKDLTHQGYDVFFDFNGIASGDFEQVILANIKARAHFLVVLTPSSLERCNDPGDWLRREIETALDTQRNIVPLMLEGFDFATPAIASHLTGKLATLNRYNALHVPAAYFDEAMERLRNKYLNVPLDAVLHPTTASARQIVKAEQAAASAASPVQPQDLTARQIEGMEFLQGRSATRQYTEAIRLNPNDANAYCARGMMRRSLNDPAGALQDFDTAIRLDPDYSWAYIGRGNARSDNGDLVGALQDYDAAIRLNADDPYAYKYRAQLYETKSHYAAAAADFQKYVDLGGGAYDLDQVEIKNRIRRLNMSG